MLYLGTVRAGGVFLPLTTAYTPAEIEYFLDAANTAKYEGHDLWNLRVMVTPTPRWWLGVRVNNLTDKLYADRADFAFGNHRYFPGRQREVYVQLGYHTQ